MDEQEAFGWYPRNPADRIGPYAIVELLSRDGGMVQFDHLNVLRMEDFGEDHGIPYVVSPLLRGRKLFDEVVENGALDAAWAFAMGPQLFAGLAHIHHDGTTTALSPADPGAPPHPMIRPTP